MILATCPRRGLPTSHFWSFKSQCLLGSGEGFGPPHNLANSNQVGAVLGESTAGETASWRNRGAESIVNSKPVQLTNAKDNIDHF